MGIFDKAKDMLGDEQKTDAALDKVEQFAKNKLGEDKAEQISKVRDAVDERIGDGSKQDREQTRPDEGQH